MVLAEGKTEVTRLKGTAVEAAGELGLLTYLRPEESEETTVGFRCPGELS